MKEVPSLDKFVEAKAQGLLGEQYQVNSFIAFTTDEKRAMFNDLENRLRGKSQQEQETIKDEWLKEVNEKIISLLPRGSIKKGNEK